jgi:hypothetical protein
MVSNASAIRLARLLPGALAPRRTAATLAPRVPLPAVLLAPQPAALTRARAPRAARATSTAALAAGSAPRAPRVTLAALIAEKDARLAEKDARLAEKDARLAFTERELVERLAFTERELVERLADKQQLLAEMDKRFEVQGARHTELLAAALHAAAVAQGQLSVCSIFSDAVSTAWVACQARGPEVRGARSRVVALLDRCPGFVAYLRVAAADNGVDPEGVLDEVRKLYPTLCSRAHGDAPEGSADLASAVFDNLGRTALVAYAGVVHFSGRRISLYDAARAALPLVMRTERGCHATEAAIRTSLPLVEERVAATVFAGARARSAAGGGADDGEE